MTAVEAGKLVHLRRVPCRAKFLAWFVKTPSVTIRPNSSAVLAARLAAEKMNDAKRPVLENAFQKSSYRSDFE